MFYKDEFKSFCSTLHSPIVFNGYNLICNLAYESITFNKVGYTIVKKNWHIAPIEMALEAILKLLTLSSKLCVKYITKML